MIYMGVEKKIRRASSMARTKSEEFGKEIERLRAAIAAEDSKSKEALLREELKQACISQRVCWDEIARVQEAVFKGLLAKEYNVVDNPKFEQAYRIAYEQGHSSGFSEIENYFSDLVELIK